MTLHSLPLLLAATLAGAAGTVHDGRKGEIDVRPPRVEGAAAEIHLDGVLDEAVWQRAARLTGFSQFAPADGVPAADSTEVLVWYSPTAIHFGVRAFAPTGTVNATLADRDKIAADDHVQFLLGTFDDTRQALVFAVNPLGVQSDGTLVETGSTSSGGFMNNSGSAREAPDLSADFVFQSKGRVTERGYEVEVRIPFKSIRYQSARVQRWAFQVVRKTQRTGAEDTWTPARRGAASFLAQGGHLVGLEDLRRGLVLDVTPVVTQRTNGARLASSAGTIPSRWDYDARAPELGGNVRWGITNNLALTGTVRPDFSQVEADAQQVQFDPRSAINYAERRPFFLEGIEQFAVPSQLIYTRRIVQPAAAVKLTGKVAGTNVAVLSAVDDDPALPREAGHPRFQIARITRDVGRQSRIGAVYTDRAAPGEYNRVFGADTRIVFGQVYTAAAQAVGSATRRNGATVTAPLWNASLVRNGRRFGFTYTASGNDERFVAGSGFISRSGIARVAATHRGRVFGKPGDLVQSVGGEVVIDGTWKHDSLFAGARALEEKLHFNTNAQLRGGWSAGASVLVETFRYDPDLYRDYWVVVPKAVSSIPGVMDTVPYVGTPALPNRDYVLTLNTPQFRHFSANVFVIWGQDENFYEWSSSDILFTTLGLTLRPSERLRADLNYQLQRFERSSDGSRVGQTQIPRVKVEYQIARPMFVRVVGQYVAQEQDALRDDSRTNGPILLRRGTGFVRAAATSSNRFRGDVLFSYQPTPGTVFFAGYGSTLSEARALRFDDLRRTTDGFFLKWSYLWRV